MTDTSQSGWYRGGGFLLTRAREQWLAVSGWAILGGIAAVGTVLLLPSYYQAGASFQAESPTPASVSGALAGLASQIGGLQLTTQSNSQLFGDLLTSESVLRRVALATYPWRGASIPLASVYGYEDESPGLRDFLTAKKLRKAMSVNVNIRTGVVSFSVEARTPELAIALADTTLAALNQANINLRQARAAAERTFTAERAEHARQELAGAEAALAGFYERNRVIASPSLQLEESRLKRVADMAQQVYVQLRLQEEQAAVQEVRNTPAISVLDPPVLPVKRSWPKRRSGVLGGVIVGLALGLARAAFRTSSR